MKIIVAILLSLTSAAFATTVATPTFLRGTGSYINAVFDAVQSNPNASVVYCYSLNGVTPTATVAGTCDATFYSSTGAYFQVTVSGTVAKAIGTAVGKTNSAVASATYTITSLPTTKPVSTITPVKITSAGANVVDEVPHILKAANGTLLLFYSEGLTGVSVDNGGPARIMFKTCASPCTGTWVTPTSTGNCASGDPGTGCFYDDSGKVDGTLVVGGGLTYNNTVIVLMPQFSGVLLGTFNGVLETRSTDNGVTWSVPAFITTPTYSSANEFTNPTSDMISIPSGSPGVTGPCATGCIFTPILGENGGATGLIFSYNDGVAWTDPVTIPQTWPYSVEEKALIWTGGMNLLMFQRPSWSGSVNGGWPVPLMVLYSSDLGTTWNSYSYNTGQSTQYGSISNLPVSTCAVAPNVSWSDNWTEPSVVVDPQQPTVATMLIGERFNCSGVNKFRWQIVTFDFTTAFTNAGQNLPLPQILDIDPIVTAQPHTTYSTLAVLSNSQLLMAFERGNTTTTEDIYTTVISYLGQAAVSSIGFVGGTTIQ
jgi:hypothetical protein